MVLFSFDNVWWGSGKVRPMLLGFLVWGEKGVMENWVDLPGFGEEKSRVGWGSGKDFKRSKAFVCEFGLWMRGLNVSAF